MIFAAKTEHLPQFFIERNRLMKSLPVNVGDNAVRIETAQFRFQGQDSPFHSFSQGLPFNGIDSRQYQFKPGSHSIKAIVEDMHNCVAVTAG